MAAGLDMGRCLRSTYPKRYPFADIDLPILDAALKLHLLKILYSLKLAISGRKRGY